MYRGVRLKLNRPVVLHALFVIYISSAAHGLSSSRDSIESLEALTVHDRTEVEKLKSSAVNMTIIEGKDLIGRAVSLTDALDRVAGVKVRSLGGTGSGERISIRGLEGKRVRVFIDDAPITALDGIFGLNDLPVQLIERVEIYKGVVPAKFGSDALGGAINIVTVERTYSYADLTYKPSSYNTHQAMLLSKYCRDNGFYVGLGGIFNYSDNNYPMNLNAILDRNDPKLAEMERTHDRYRMNLTGVSIGKWDGWFDDIGAEIVYFGKKKEIQGIEWPVTDAHTFSHTGLVAPYFEKEDFFLEGLDFDLNLAIIGSLGALVDTASTIYTDWFTSPKINSLQGETDIYSKHDSRDTLVGGQARLNLEYSLNKSNRIDLNNVFQTQNFTPYDAVDAGGKHVSIAEYPSWFASNVINAGYDLKLLDDRINNYFSAKLFMQKVSVDTSGVNSNENLMGKITTTSNSTFNGGIGNAISFKPVPCLTLYASYQHAVRLPDENELFGDGVSVMQNLTLQSETSENGMAGCHVLVKRSNVFMSRLEFELSGFTRFTDDLIKLEPGLLAAVYKNIDRVRTLGSEADLKMDIMPWLYITGNVTFQDMVYLESKTEPFKEGKRLANLPWLFGNAGVELSKKDIILKNSLAKLFWEAQFTHEYYSAVKVVDSPKDLIPSHFLQNVGIQYSWKGALDIGFELHNLTNSEAYDLYETPIPGRTWHLIAHYFIKKRRS